LLVTGCWLLVAGSWLLVAGYRLLVAGCWLKTQHANELFFSFYQQRATSNQQLLFLTFLPF